MSQKKCSKTKDDIEVSKKTTKREFFGARVASGLHISLMCDSIMDRDNASPGAFAATHENPIMNWVNHIAECECNRFNTKTK